MNEGLRKITVNRLLDSAVAASGKEATASTHIETSAQRATIDRLAARFKAAE